MRCCGRTRPRRGARGQSVIKTHRAQRSFGDGLIADEVKDLHEAWMKHADQLLDDPQIVAAVYQALAQRHPQSRTRGRPGTPAEVVLRLLVLKHMRNWSYEVLEREVRANLVYRDFTRVGATKMPDAKTMGRWGPAVGPEAIKQVHERIVQIAHDQRVAAGRRMRVDTTVVETNIHYPTDSSLLGDGVRVLTRTMKKIAVITGAVGAKLRDRRRSVKLGCWRSRGRRAPKADKTRPGWHRPTADYWRRPAGWSVKPSASPRRSARASSRPRTTGGSWCWKGCVASWRPWCRGSSR
jgi:transposase, IS5 family